MLKLNQLACASALAAALAAGALPASAAPTISFGAALVNGNDVQVDVIVSDLGDDIVAAYDLDIGFDATTLTFAGFTFSVALGDPNLVDGNGDQTEVLTLGPFDLGGVVDVFANSYLSDDVLVALQGGGPVTLGTLKFTSQQADVSSLQFFWDEFNDVKGRSNQVIIPGGNIPEPASYALAGLALAGLLASRRRRLGATQG